MAPTQVVQIAMMATDLAWIDHIGIEAVAAAAIAGMISSVGLSFAAGVISAVGPLAAQACGDGALVRRSERIGLWVAILLWVPIMVLPLQGEQIVLALCHEPAIAAGSTTSVRAGLGHLAGIVVLAIRSFMAAMAARTASAPFRDECRSAVHASVLFMAISSRSANER
nr:MATE family efflux transporter [Bradyrhizobium sp. AC87j1]